MHFGARFRDRRDAGRRLGAALSRYRDEPALVLGLARGGVPVAAEVAGALEAPLDVIVVRKLGAPGQPELAIGAVASEGSPYVIDAALRMLDVDAAYLERVTERERETARVREERYRNGRWAQDVAGRSVIIVDDGLATGATMRAAVRAVRRHDPARIVVAAPVGSPEACDELREDADEVFCLDTPSPFWAVGAHYDEFSQTSDEEVQRALYAARGRTSGSS